MPLPTPIGRQKEVLCLPAEGHFVVLGTAGSGKTTLAILRTAYLADPTTDHSGRTLLMTFNRTLVAYLKYLQEHTLGNVVVENYHKFARGYLNNRNKMERNCICGPEYKNDLIAKAVVTVSSSYDPHPLFNNPVEVFSEEIQWINQHGIKTYEQYDAVERIGRASLRITRILRKQVFEIYEEYKRLRDNGGKMYDWDDLATAVSEEFDNDDTPRKYRHIVIDEGQDFSPEMIRSLSKAIEPGGSITLFGDVAQQIYGYRLSWRSAGLRVKKIWEFTENYRNSKQIALLAIAITKMPYYTEIPDIVVPVAPSADGPLPTIVKCKTIEGEIRLVVSQAKRLSQSRNVAILFRNREDEQLIVPYLPSDSIRLHKDMDYWTSAPGIRYGTYHSGKGLEFDVVILPFCREDRLPDPEVIKAFGEDEAAAKDGRLLYVGVTRAKALLIITYTDIITSLLPIDPELYKLVNRDV